MLVVCLPPGATNIKYPYVEDFTREAEALSRDVVCVEAGDFKDADDIDAAGAGANDYGCYKWRRIDFTPAPGAATVLTYTSYFVGTVRLMLRVMTETTKTATFLGRVDTTEGSTVTTTSADVWEEIDLGEFTVAQGDVIDVDIADPDNVNNVKIDYLFVKPVEPVRVFFDNTEYHVAEPKVLDNEIRVLDPAHVLDFEYPTTTLYPAADLYPDDTVVSFRNGIVEMNYYTSMRFFNAAGDWTALAELTNEESSRSNNKVRLISFEMIEMEQKFTESSIYYENKFRIYRGKPFIEFDAVNSKVTIRVSQSTMDKYQLPETTGVAGETISAGAIGLGSKADDWFLIYKSTGTKYGVWFTLDGTISAINVTDVGGTDWDFEFTMSGNVRYWIGAYRETEGSDQLTNASKRNIKYLAMEAKRRYTPAFKIEGRP